MSPIVDGATALTSTIVPARRFGLRPGTGSDMTTALQRAADDAPVGSLIETEPGEWVVDGAVSVTRQVSFEFRGHWVLQDAITTSASNVQFTLAPGCYIEKDPTGTAIEPFLFSGTTPSAWDDITVDPSAGEVSITVTTPGTFAAGDWITIKDNQAPYSGSGTHWEKNRVRSKSGSVLTLEYPLSDSYATISTVKPSVSKFTPVIRSGIVGPGKISNGSTSDASIGNAGVRFSHCVAGYATGLEVFQMQQDAIRYFDSYCGLIDDNYLHDASNFDTSGRAMNVARSTHVIVSNNRMVRVRHGVDISNFCRHVIVEGNIGRGCAESMYKTHPDCKWIYIDGNEVDGAYGFAAGGAEWGSTSAPGIGIGQNNHHIYVMNNRIANVRANGITAIVDQTGDIYIGKNTIVNANMAGGTVITAGIGIAQTVDTYTQDGPWVIEDNEISECQNQGIACGISDVTIRRNKIKNITGSSGTLAGINVRPYVSSGTAAALSNVVIDDNDIDTTTGYGVLVGHSSAGTTDIEVTRNKIQNCQLSGIAGTPAEIDEATVTGNRVRNCNLGNSISHAGIKFGISGESDVASTNLVIEDNTVWDTYSRGIMCVVNGSKILRNKVYDLLGTNPLGIYIPEGAGGQVNDGTLVEANVVWNCYSGIYTPNTAGAVTSLKIVRNTSHSNAESGIRVRGGCDNTHVVDNICYGNASFDIRDNEGATNTHVRSSSLVSASSYGAVPNTGADMLSKIQQAFDLCPIGSMLVFEPGTYVLTNGVEITRAISVSAYGAVLDIGTSTPADGYVVQVGSSSANVTIKLSGLKVQRTVAYTGSPSSAASTAFLHKGFVYKALINSVVEDCHAVGFQEGHYITGVQSPALGMAYTDFHRLRTNECRYGVWITNGNAVTTSGGYANELNFFGGRQVINTNTGSNKHVTDPANFQAFRVDYPNNATLSGSIPNNVRVYGMSLEGEWGRKVFCRGEDVYLHECRYEFPNGGTDLEVERVNSAGTGRRVWFIGGQGLDAAVLVQTATIGTPLYVGKLAVSHLDYSGGAYPAVDTDVTCADLLAKTGTFYNPSGSALPAIVIRDSSGATVRVEFQASINDGAGDRYGGFEVFDNLGAFANSLGVATSESMPSSSKPMFVRRGLIVNKEGGDYDSRVGGSSEPNLTYWDASLNRVGVGTNTPDALHHVNGAQHVGGDAEIDGDLNHDGSNVGFFGAEPAGQSTGWSATNVTTDKSFDADATTVDELADVLGTLIDQLKTHGLLGA